MAEKKDVDLHLKGKLSEDDKEKILSFLKPDVEGAHLNIDLQAEGPIDGGKSARIALKLEWRKPENK